MASNEERCDHGWVRSKVCPFCLSEAVTRTEPVQPQPVIQPLPYVPLPQYPMQPYYPYPYVYPWWGIVPPTWFFTTGTTVAPGGSP